MTILPHKIRLYPNREAEIYLTKSCGTSRFAYNWARARWEALYKAGQRPDIFSLLREFNAIKGTDFPWVRELSKWTTQRSLLNLGKAYQRFFAKKARYPRFKKKGQSNDSFYLGARYFKLSGKYLTLPKLKQAIKMAQELRFEGPVKSVAISRNRANEWYASFTVELPSDYIYPHECESQACVGVDVGIKTLATLSNGMRIDNPAPLRAAERHLARHGRALSRKQRGSRNRAKARLRLAKAHLKVTRIRQDTLHRATSLLVKTFRFIGVEDLNIRGMVKNHRLAKSLSDAAFGEFFRQLEYKATLAHSFVVKADRFYPSSKRCSGCGHILESLALSEREWACPACGAHHDRDDNASKNLELVALRYRETLNACGEDVRPQTRERALKRGKFGSTRRPPMKQECLERSRN